MMSQLMWEPDQSGADRQGMVSAQQGLWLRQGDRIVVFLDGYPSGEEELGEAPDDNTNVQQAIRNGTRNENQLTDTIFNARHPERRGQHLLPNERQLVQEWVAIRDNIVRPALRAATGVAPAAP